MGTWRARYCAWWRATLAGSTSDSGGSTNSARASLVTVSLVRVAPPPPMRGEQTSRCNPLSLRAARITVGESTSGRSPSINARAAWWQRRGMMDPGGELGPGSGDADASGCPPPGVTASLTAAAASSPGTAPPAAAASVSESLTRVEGTAQTGEAARCPAAVPAISVASAARARTSPAVPSPWQSSTNSAW